MWILILCVAKVAELDLQWQKIINGWKVDRGFLEHSKDDDIVTALE